jgi:hypothetical protein
MTITHTGGGFTEVLHQARADASPDDDGLSGVQQLRAAMDAIGSVVGSGPEVTEAKVENIAARVARLYGAPIPSSADADNTPPPVSIATVETELALHPAMSIDHLRALSTLKMTLANSIIDAAIARRLRQRG